MNNMRRRFIKNGCNLVICLLLSICMVGCKTEEDNTKMKSIKYCPLSISEAKQMEPNAYDLDMAKKKGLAKNDIYDKNYLEVQAAYLSLLNHYLCEKVKLDRYQEVLDKSVYKFVENEETVYSKAGAFGRKNIFIRNNVYVERLSKEDLDILQEGMNNGEVNVTDELLAMIERTMENIISVRYEDSDKVFEAIYDMGVFQTNMAPSNALVFTISYDFEYDENGNIIDNEKEDKKAELVEELHKKMSDKMSKELGIPVSVFY